MTSAEGTTEQAASVGSQPFRIPLNLPQGDPQQSFLDHFNAALRQVSSNRSSSAGFHPDGTFRSAVTLPLLVDAQPVTLTWTATKIADGTLKDIAIETGTLGAEERRWAPIAQAIVTTALADALSNKRRRLFRRVRFHYVGPQLDGEYWLPGFRLAPALAEDTAPLLVNAERVVYLDFNVDAIDDVHAEGVAQEIARRHAARLSLLLNVGLFVPVPVDRWVIVNDQHPVTGSRRYFVGYLDPKPLPDEMPGKGVECRLGAYSGKLTEFYRYAGKRLQCPEETRRVLRGIDGAAPRIRDAFDRCARLWQVANVIGEQFPSAGLAYRIAAAEAITEGNPEYTSFADFIRKNAHSTIVDLEPALDFLYRSVRCAHFHGGQFPLGEFARVRFFDPVMDEHDVQSSNVRMIGSGILRNAIVTWILNAVPPTEEPV